MWAAESVWFLVYFMTALTCCLQAINRAANMIVGSCDELKWQKSRDAFARRREETGDPRYL